MSARGFNAVGGWSVYRTEMAHMVGTVWQKYTTPVASTAPSRAMV